MPRPKGSKNKVKLTTQPIDFTTLIAEKSSSKEALVADIASLEENLTSIREELKAKKAELKKLDTVISRTQTENSLRVRCGKMWHLNEDYPYSDKRHGGN